MRGKLATASATRSQRCLPPVAVRCGARSCGERSSARSSAFGASWCLRLRFNRSALHHTRGGMGAKHEDVFDGRRPVRLSIFELLP